MHSKKRSALPCGIGTTLVRLELTEAPSSGKTFFVCPNVSVASFVLGCGRLSWLSSPLASILNLDLAGFCHTRGMESLNFRCFKTTEVSPTHGESGFAVLVFSFAAVWSDGTRL